MKLILWTLLICLISISPSRATVQITDDYGGLVALYVERYAAMRDSNEPVVINGICASACTLVLGMIDHDRICVMPNAKLGFHAAHNYLDPSTINEHGTQLIFAIYPLPLQEWILQHGGLTLQMIFLRGKALRRMYQPCPAKDR